MGRFRAFLRHRAFSATLVVLYVLATLHPVDGQTSRAYAPPTSLKPASPATASQARPATDPVTSTSRLALVIGNAKYHLAGASLKNPGSDATLVAQVLRDQGFDVIYRENVDFNAFRSAIVEFVRRAQTQQGVALFYYAGHAMSLDGRNYLLPVDFHASDQYEAVDNAIDVDESVLGRLDNSKSQFKIVVLDSCRNNPFAVAGTRGLTRGLTDMARGGGSLIAFSTAPGKVAEDGDGRNSVFTAHLANELRKGGEIEQVFKRVRVAVHDATGGRQEPWVNASLHSDLWIGKPDTADPQARAQIDDEQKRILENIEIAENKRDAERQRDKEERAKEKNRIDAELRSLRQDLEQSRLERETLEQLQKRQMDEMKVRVASLSNSISETQKIATRRPLTPEESDTVKLALAQTQALEQQSVADAQALQTRLDAARAREAERRGRLAALVSQAARLDEPIAPQRPRVAADGTMFIRGISLPKNVRIEPVRADIAANCAAFQGAWSGRWDGLRTVELWIARVDGDCSAQIVYGRGGQSINAEAPKYMSSKAKISREELVATLEDGATIRARRIDNDRLDAVWTRQERTAKAELHRISDDPASGTAVFAQEDRDFGARPTRYLEVPSPTKPIPLSVPGVRTVTTLELKDLLERDKNIVLIDAYRDADHMTLPGAFWRPDIGEARPGAFPLAEMAKMMDEITDRDRERRIVVFERSSVWGWYGYNAALRLVGMGYTNVYWYRGGLDAWFDAGFQMTKVSARRSASN